MYIQTLKNMILFFSTLVFWLVLITIEVLTGYSGILLQIIYGLSMFALFAAFWLVNRTTVNKLDNEFAQFFASGAIAMVLMGIFFVTVLVVGVAYKNLIEGWFK